MNITEREKQLIINGLYILESQLYSEEVEFGIMDELGTDTQPEEVRILMNKVEASE